MREIKFRAWDKEYNIMMQPDELDGEEVITGEGGVLERIIDSGFGHYDVNYQDISENRVLMQFTGLKDKNGKDIFEGDILKCKCNKKPYQFLQDEEQAFYQNNVVEWWASYSNLGYRLKNAKGKTLMIKPSSLATMEVEVIGNIYENPELLEGEPNA